MTQPLVSVVLGSRSDVDLMEECGRMLDRLGIPYETHILSAHRAPARVQQFASSAADRGIEVIIAAAGMAAHLPGVLASWTTIPVVGVPLGRPGSHGLAGLDALLSIVQMPPGVPVACMAVNGARNAALYAAAILALKHEEIRQALGRFREELAAS